MNAIEFGKVPPQSIEVEEIVIGSLLIDSDCILNIGNLVRPEMFYKPAHVLIYESIENLNRNNKKIDVGLDGQISNFAVIDYNPVNPKLESNTKLYYLDTSTPMFRINGAEAMQAELFLKSAPTFLRWLLKALFLEETVGRYYDWRKVSIDLVANFFKEQKPELIPGLIKLINNFFEKEAADFEIEPITLEEVQKYYKSDANMWVIFQSVRKFDRYLKTKVFKKKYAFYLPGKIER